MLTRSKSVRAEAPGNSGDAGVPYAGVPDGAPIPDSLETSAAPNPADNSNLQNFQEPIIQSTFSRTSLASRSSQSSATVRALRATAEAKLARQQLERKFHLEKERREREQQLENERRRIEELELAAELASLEAGRSGSSVVSASRTKAWVAEQVQSNFLIKDHKLVPDTPRAQVSDNKRVPDTPRAQLCDNQCAPDAPRPQHCANQCSISKLATTLTTFSGQPVEWLIFKKNYNSTKHLFSNLENLNRLRHALQSRARESVGILLLTADDPNEVKTLPFSLL